QVLRRADQVLAGARSRLRIAELEEDRRRRARQVGLAVATQQVVDHLSRALGHRLDVDHLAARGLRSLLVEAFGDGLHPLLFFRAIGEEEIDRPGLARRGWTTPTARGGPLRWRAAAR